MASFCRIDDSEIRAREPIAEPDALIVQDPTLLHQVDVFSGLGPDGYILINSVAQLRRARARRVRAARSRRERLLTMPATELAREHLGRPLPNAVLLGGFAALSGLISIESVARGDPREVPRPVGDGNVAAAEAAFELRRGRDEGAGACLSRSRAPQAVAEAVALCRPEVISRLPDLAADAHRRGPLRHGPDRRARRPAST